MLIALIVSVFLLGLLSGVVLACVCIAADMNREREYRALLDQ